MTYRRMLYIFAIIKRNHFEEIMCVCFSRTTPSMYIYLWRFIFFSCSLFSKLWTVKCPDGLHGPRALTLVAAGEKNAGALSWRKRKMAAKGVQRRPAAGKVVVGAIVLVSTHG